MKRSDREKEKLARMDARIAQMNRRREEMAKRVDLEIEEENNPQNV